MTELADIDRGWLMAIAGWWPNCMDDVQEDDPPWLEHLQSLSSPQRC